MSRAEQNLDHYLKKNGLKRSKQRDRILEIFLGSDRHLSAEDLLELVKKKYPNIGYSTVYRSLALFHEAGIARVVQIGDGVTRYEKSIKDKEHHHFVCERCGKLIEFSDDSIGDIVEKHARRKRFAVSRSRLDVFGICKECRSRK